MAQLFDKFMVGSGVVSIVAIIALCFAAASGWVMNIVILIGLDFSSVTAEIVLRIIGVFMVPVGCVAGWI